MGSDDTQFKPGSKPKHRFPPGVSGNPGGRYKGLERELRDQLKAVRHGIPTLDASGQPVIGADGQPVMQMVDGYAAAFHRIWGIIMNGDDKDSLTALKLLYERMHGMPKQKVSITEDEDTSEEVAWSAVSVAKKRELLETILLITPPEDAPSEH